MKMSLIKGNIFSKSNPEGQETGERERERDLPCHQCEYSGPAWPQQRIPFQAPAPRGSYQSPLRQAGSPPWEGGRVSPSVPSGHFPWLFRSKSSLCPCNGGSLEARYTQGGGGRKGWLSKRIFFFFPSSRAEMSQKGKKEVSIKKGNLSKKKRRKKTKWGSHWVRLGTKKKSWLFLREHDEKVMIFFDIGKKVKKEAKNFYNWI